MVAKSLEETVRDLAARRDIERAILDYIRGQDRLEPETQRRAFHDDAHVDCGTFAGDPDAYVAFAQHFLGLCKGSHHMLGQMDIRIDGDVGHGEIYLIAWHRIVEDETEKDLIVGARYIDRYECRNGVWKIAKRREVTDWVRTDPPSDSFIAKYPQLHLGQRGADDFSHHRTWPRNT